MRVLIIAMGTTGDVAPYAGLGARLIAAGHQVTIAALRDMADLVTDAGLEFRALPWQAKDSLATADGLGRRRTSIGDGLRALRGATHVVDDLNSAIRAVAGEGPDVIVSHGGAVLPVACIAEALSIPMLCAYIIPAHPTSAFPPLLGLPSLGGFGNRVAHQLVLHTESMALSASTRRLRRSLGLDARSPFGVFASVESAGVPICYAVSPTVLPRPTDWPPGIEVVGYLWPTSPDGWRAPSELLNFLAAGPPPVFVDFGSVSVGAGERLGPVIADALRTAGVRGIVQSGWANLAVAGDDLLTIGYVPYEWLFPQVAAVVHHAGAGTTAAALRAGVPSVPVPVTWDHPFWARRLRELGTAPAVLSYRRLSPGPLAGAIRMAIDRPEYRQRAAEVAALMRREDGAGVMIAALERMCDRS